VLADSARDDAEHGERDGEDHPAEHDFGHPQERLDAVLDGAEGRGARCELLASRAPEPEAEQERENHDRDHEILGKGRDDVRRNEGRERLKEVDLLVGVCRLRLGARGMKPHERVARPKDVRDEKPDRERDRRVHRGPDGEPDCRASVDFRLQDGVDDREEEERGGGRLDELDDDLANLTKALRVLAEDGPNDEPEHDGKEDLQIQREALALQGGG
jgi:hypothetical protein